MTLKNTNRLMDERIKMRSAEQNIEPESSAPQPRRQVRPEIRKLFNARWKRNEPGYRLLAEH